MQVCHLWLLSFIFSNGLALLVYRYFVRRREFRDILRSSEQGLTVSRFARILFFCCIVLCVCLPLSIYVFFLNVQSGFESFSWSRIHDPSTWYQINKYPMNAPIFDSWEAFAISFLLFVFFGLGVDAFKMYREWCLMIRLNKVFPRSKWLSSKSSSSVTSSTVDCSEADYSDKHGSDLSKTYAKYVDFFYF